MKKTIKTLMLLLVAAVSISFTYSPQKANTTVNFKVFGSCEICKERIEIALDVPGVKKAIWDVSSQMVTVTYNSKKLEVRLTIKSQLTAQVYKNSTDSNSLTGVFKSSQPFKSQLRGLFSCMSH